MYNYMYGKLSLCCHDNKYFVTIWFNKKYLVYTPFEIIFKGVVFFIWFLHKGPPEICTEEAHDLDVIVGTI